MIPDQENSTSGPPGASSDLRIDPCPDCNAGAEHESTCPLAAAIEAMARNDAFYFERFPWMRQRCRAITAAERAEMARRGFVFPAEHHMHVTLYAGDFWLHEVVA